jgi:hypothetical protein
MLLYRHWYKQFSLVFEHQLGRKILSFVKIYLPEQT